MRKQNLYFFAISLLIAIIFILTFVLIHKNTEKVIPLNAYGSFGNTLLFNSFAFKTADSTEFTTLKIPSCGDGICDRNPPTGPPENCYTCHSDCGDCPVVCGKYGCQAPTENCTSCIKDCGTCGGGGFCGDNYCSIFEDCGNCPQDCNCNPVCGDEVCELPENCQNCIFDCGPCNGGGSSGSCTYLKGPPSTGNLPYCK